MATVLRVFFIFVGLAFIGAIFAWIAGQDGVLSFTMAGWRIDTSTAVALTGLVLVLVGVLLLDRLVRQIFSGPKRALDAMGRNKRVRGETALTQGLVAVAAGDISQARREAKRALRLLNRSPLSLLLAAQAEALDGEADLAVKHYTAMLDDPQTEFLARRGLFELALRRNDFDMALAQARRALALQYNAPWVLNAVFVLESRQGNWQDAAETLEHALRARLIAPAQARRRRAVLLTAWAWECAAIKPLPDKQSVPPTAATKLAFHEREALTKALEALALTPDLVPAATLASDLLKKDGYVSRAEAIIEKAWVRNPHPDLAASYERLAAGEPARVKAEMLDRLVARNPTHPESRLIAATNAVARGEYEAARILLGALDANILTARVLALLAELVRAEEGDEAKARRFMARAIHAPREAEWTCKRCGEVALEWTALCPACGEFDGLVWRAPNAPARAFSLLGELPEKNMPVHVQSSACVYAHDELDLTRADKASSATAPEDEADDLSTPEGAVRKSSKDTWLDDKWRKNKRRETALHSALQSSDFFYHQPDDPGPALIDEAEDYDEDMEQDDEENAEGLGHDTLGRKPPYQP